VVRQQGKREGGNLTQEVSAEMTALLLIAKALNVPSADLVR